MYNMKAILLKDVPPETGRRFKLHCVEINISMKEGLLRLMDLEVEQRLLSCPVESKPKGKKRK